MEGQVGERDVADVEVVGQLGQLLREDEGEDLLVHAHSKLVVTRRYGNNELIGEVVREEQPVDAHLRVEGQLILHVAQEERRDEVHRLAISTLHYANTISTCLQRSS